MQSVTVVCIGQHTDNNKNELLSTLVSVHLRNITPLWCHGETGGVSSDR